MLGKEKGKRMIENEIDQLGSKTHGIDVEITTCNCKYS